MLNIQEEEAQLGRWPRRLLHVSSQTSYEWRDDNDYGGHKSPPYNVVTYTWGRMRLQNWEYPELEPMTVHNVEWDIPRVRLRLRLVGKQPSFSLPGTVLLG